MLDRVLQDLEEANAQPCLTTGIYPCHVGMCIETDAGTISVAEMQWPVCRILRLDKWLDTYGTDQYWTAPMKTPLDTDEGRALTAWWEARLGNWYDLPDLVQLGIMGWWNSLCAKLHLPLSCTANAIAVKGVCSVNCAWAYESLGRYIPSPLRQSPATIIGLPWLGTPIRIA